MADISGDRVGSRAIGLESDREWEGPSELATIYPRLIGRSTSHPEVALFLERKSSQTMHPEDGLKQICFVAKKKFGIGFFSY